MRATGTAKATNPLTRRTSPRSAWWATKKVGLSPSTPSTGWVTARLLSARTWAARHGAETGGPVTPRPAR